MVRVRLIHWNEAEARQRVEELGEAGLRVDFDPPTPAVLKALTADPPDVVVIDLGRLPAQGREVAVALRNAKRTRHLPLIFVGGAEEKVARVRETLPDASYCAAEDLTGAVHEAIRRPAKSPVVPASQMQRGAGVPLAKKLDIKPASVVVLLAAPEGFEQLLDPLPDDVTFRTSNRGKRDLTIWFVEQLDAFLERLHTVSASLKGGSLWVAYPKKSSGRPTTITGNDLRTLCRDLGLIDYKVCAIDATWTGIKFTKRKSDAQ